MPDLLDFARSGSRAATALLALACLLGSGVGAPRPALAHPLSASASLKAAAPAAPHIMTVIMENTDYSQFAGSPTEPYLNGLAHQYADFTQAYGWVYPSQPNYRVLLTGSDEGVDADCNITTPGCAGSTHPQLDQQLEAAGITWHAFYQGDPSGCYLGDSGVWYPYWHNVFRYFADFRAQCRHISNFTDLIPLLSSAQPPDFVWVAPDIRNDGGDAGTMQTGDVWLNRELPRIMATPWYREGGQIIILYDTGYEDAGGYNGSSGGRIPLVVVSAHTKGMGTITTGVNTAGVLRSIEEAYGLSLLGQAKNPKNGSLGAAIVAGRPTGAPPPLLPHGATVRIGTAGTSAPTVVGGATDALNGVYTFANGSTIEVGENRTGSGVVYTAAHGALTAPETAALESVSCLSATLCYAVGLSDPAKDQAALVAIHNGRPVHTTLLSALFGLYGIACPTKGTCYAVGYNTNNGADAVITIRDGRASLPRVVAGGDPWLNAISCPTATRCYAVGLVHHRPAIVPIRDGVPGAPVVLKNAWYADGIACGTVGTCLAVGENSHMQGVVMRLAHGRFAGTQVVPGTAFLYGVGVLADGADVLTGVSSLGSGGYGAGAYLRYSDGSPGAVHVLARANGLGQVACARTTCTTVGAFEGD